PRILPETYLQFAIKLRVPSGTVNDKNTTTMSQHVIFRRRAMADTRPETTGRKSRDGTVPKAAPELKSGERLLTPKEAANLLRLSTSGLAKARMRGDGPPYVKPCRSVLYPEGTLIQWVKSRTRLSTSEG